MHHVSLEASAAVELLTQLLSETDSIRGAYWDVGNADVPFGEPSIGVPDTLYRLLVDPAEIVGRIGTGGGWPRFWKFEYELDVCIEGGVVEPIIEFRVDEDFDVGIWLIGAFPLLSWLEPLGLSGWKLAFERRRKSFKKDGAITFLSVDHGPDTQLRGGFGNECVRASERGVFPSPRSFGSLGLAPGTILGDDD